MKIQIVRRLKRGPHKTLAETGPNMLSAWYMSTTNAEAPIAIRFTTSDGRDISLNCDDQGARWLIAGLQYGLNSKR